MCHEQIQNCSRSHSQHLNKIHIDKSLFCLPVTTVFQALIPHQRAAYYFHGYYSLNMITKCLFSPPLLQPNCSHFFVPYSLFFFSFRNGKTLHLFSISCPLPKYAQTLPVHYHCHHHHKNFPSITIKKISVSFVPMSQIWIYQNRLIQN